MPSAKTIAITAVIALLAVMVAKRVPGVKDYL